MDFNLTEEHGMIKEMAREFAEREIAPSISELDEKGEYDPDMYKKMAEKDLLGFCIPEQYGGLSLDYISLAIASEELERIDTAARVILSVHIGLNSLTLLQWGTEEQKQKYLVPQAKGEQLAGYGLTEPNAGSDAANLYTTAVRDGDDYILNGEKMWISAANTGHNFLIFAATDKSKGHRGISAFIVERSFPGFSSMPIHGKMGVRAGDTGSISLSDVRVPKENLLGEEGEGFKIAMSALDNGRYTIAGGAVGIIQACLDASVKYAHERTTFGKPIGEHQLVQRMISKMAMSVETGRLLYYKAGWQKNRGIRSTKATSLAKVTNCDAAFEAANDAVEIHGAYGYSNEFPVERYLRNCRGAVIYEGTREVHQLIQAQYALGYRKDKPLRCELPKWPFE
jgi:alkylation response protein AidB-like acyl-CoA dehydrogenase